MATELKDEPGAINPEVMPAAALEKVAPQIPVTIEELAALDEGVGVGIVEGRREIIDTLRKASILLTHPQDWVLYKADDRVTAYLQDCGCQRIKPLWGIDITPVGDFERVSVQGAPDDEYAYSVKGDGYCGATDSAVKGIEGLRYSTENFCKDLPPLQRMMRVRQAAVANRDGNIIRTLTGMKCVALEEIDTVWKAEGKGKNIALCVPGRGYGSKADRQGAGGTAKGTPTDVQPPVCEICNKTMKFVDGTGKTYDSFWSCPDKRKVDGKWNEHSSVNDKQYRASLAKAKEPTDRDAGQEG